MKFKSSCYACRVKNAADEARRHPSKTSFNMLSLLMLKCFELKAERKERTFCADHDSRFESFVWMVRHHVNHAGFKLGLRID